MKPTSIAAVEVGFGQADDVVAIAAKAKLRVVERLKDFAGIERCLVFSL
jgi:methylase of polypeptide subunit release factors